MSFLNKLFGSSVTNIDVTALQAKLNEKSKPLVLDVREPSEYAAGHIADSKLLPLHQLANRMSELPKEREIICVCASGSRSSSASRQLMGAGFTVLNLSGGMGQWLRAGLPIKKGKSK